MKGRSEGKFRQAKDLAADYAPMLRGTFNAVTGVLARGLISTWNAFAITIRTGLRSWVRNLHATIPAMASIAMLGVLSGLVGLCGYTLQQISLAQRQDAAVIHVYLRDDATLVSIATLRSQLELDPSVVRVDYTSKADALARAQSRPGLTGLTGGGNPFPASFDVRTHSIGQLQQIDRIARESVAVDPLVPTSYDHGSYSRVEQFFTIATEAGAGFLLLMLMVAVAVSLNSVRATITSRREEIKIMRLVGAANWLITAPFVVEGAFTGTVAGLIGGGAVALVGGLAIRAGSSYFAQLTPGLNFHAIDVASAAVLSGSVLIGICASWAGLRRYLRA